MTIQPHTVTTNSESLSDPQRSLPEVLQGLMWVRICMDASKKKRKKKKEAQFKQLLVLCLFVPLDCSIIFVLTFVSVQLCVCVDWQLS